MSEYLINMYINFVLDSHTNTIQLLDNTTVLNRTAYGPNCSGDESRLTECIVDFRYCVSGDEQATVQCNTSGR